MHSETTIILKDEALPLLTALADTLSRLERLLSPELLTKVLDAFERLVDSVEASGGFLRVVAGDAVSSPAGLAGEYVAELQVSDRLGEFLAALHAIERDIDLVCQRHGILQTQPAAAGPA